MDGPIDGTERVIAHRSGGETDCGPLRRGVRRDRGETYRTIDRNAANLPAGAGHRTGAGPGRARRSGIKKRLSPVPEDILDFQRPACGRERFRWPER